MLPYTRKSVEDWAGKQVFQAGLRLVDAALVKKVEFDPEKRTISGFIDRQPRGIKSGLRLPAKGVPENQCPCPDNRDRDLFCSHVVALSVELLNIYNSPERLERLEQEKKRAERLANIDESEYINRVSADEPHVDACLQFELKAGWREALAVDEPLPVLCNIEYGDVVEPIDEAARDLPFYFSEEQENLLFVLEDICEGPPEGELALSASDWVNLLDLLGEGQEVFDGDVGQPQVLDLKASPTRLQLDLNGETGELILFLQTPTNETKIKELPAYFIARSRGWVMHSGGLWPLAKLLPEPLHSVYQRPVVVPRASVPAFMKHELSMLEHQVPVETDLMLEMFQMTPAQPLFLLEVRGSPASLAVTLKAKYEEHEVVTGRPDAGIPFSLPDPDDLLAYKIRNPIAEDRAMARLVPFGFTGHMGDALEAIVGKREVLNFLATGLPSLRRLGWKVALKGRITEFSEQADYATPVVRVDDGGAGWFEVGLDFEQSGGSDLDAADIQRAIRMGDSFVESNGKVVLFDSDAIESLVGVFDDCSSGEGSSAGTFRMDKVFSAYVQSSLDALDGVDVEAAPEWLEQSRTNNRSTTMQEVSLDEPLASTLRPYQKEGVNWLEFLVGQGYGGILADDMGLGKTLQTLTWIQYRLLKGTPGPALIVCPTSLVENWLEEAKRFTPNLRCVNLTGSGRHKHFDERDTADIAVTSYALVKRDLEVLNDRTYGIIALDEAQHIKNRSTQNAQAVKSLKGLHKVVLTGTPVENSVSDLWSIMDFLMPGYLGRHDHFKLFYESPINTGGSEGEHAQKKLRRKLHPFMLRRMKTEVAKDLPPKIEKIAYCTLTPDQRKVYQEILKTAKDKISDMVSAQGFNKSRMEVLKTLLRLRQASCHIDLLKLDISCKRPSGKMELFEELLEEAIDGGHRILLFSQFTTMLGILRDRLEASGTRYSYLDGSTKRRLDRVKEFNADHDIPIFLISLKAGGTGLNLTGADTVIHFDPWWNPAVEDQATDRAYRIGQTRTVYSQKLIARNTVEEKVLKMQQKKKSIIEATLSSDEDVVSKLSWDDVQELLSL